MSEPVEGLPMQVVVQRPVKVESTNALVAPWWMPQWPIFLTLGLYAMTWRIMEKLAPLPGQPPSELFKILATAIVLTAFVGGPVAVAYSATRNAKSKDDTIAAQAMTIATQSADGK